MEVLTNNVALNAHPLSIQDAKKEKKKTYGGIVD